MLHYYHSQANQVWNKQNYECCICKVQWQWHDEIDDAHVYEMKCTFVEAKHLGCYRQGEDVVRFKSSLPKAYYSWSYFQVFPLSLLGSLSHTKCSYPIFQSFSFHSFSHVLVIHQSCIASIMKRVSISVEHWQFELIQVPAEDSLSHDICRT